VTKLPSLSKIPFEDVWTSLQHDKKFRSGKMQMVFLSAIGRAVIQSDVEARRLQQFLRSFLHSRENGRVRS